MNRGYEKRGFLLDDFRLFHLKDIQGTDVDYHYHEFPKLILLWSGSGHYLIDGQRYVLQAGDILLIGSHRVHRPEFEEGSMYERTIIYISPEFLLRQSEKDCNLEEIFDGVSGHIVRIKESQRLFDMTTQLEQELSQDCYGRSVMSKILLLNLLVEIGRIKNYSGVPFTISATTNNTRVLEIMKYIDTHLTEELSIEQLAEQFYLSKFHMMRLFRQETGQSVYEYIVFKRLLYAKELIMQGENATESCFNAGFHSYSSFTRAYAKYFGMTPTGRKKQHAQREETFE